MNAPDGSLDAKSPIFPLNLGSLLCVNKKPFKVSIVSVRKVFVSKKREEGLKCQNVSHLNSNKGSVSRQTLGKTNEDIETKTIREG